MGRILTNDFSWSKSRHEKFSECLRAYYLHYYRSWGGWARDAPEEIKNLYVLKKLDNRFTWAGSVVHDTVKATLLAVRQGREVDAATAIEKAHRRMQREYRQSADKGYWTERSKDFTGLVE